MKKFLCYLAVLLASLYACTDSSNPIDQANDMMKAHLAPDITITIDRSSERYFPLHIPTDGGYTFDFVCGKAVLNQPGRLDNAQQRIIISINNQLQVGAGFFDGSSDPSDQKNFDEKWATDCPDYVLPR